MKINAPEINYDNIIGNYLADGYCILPSANADNLLLAEDYIKSLNYDRNSPGFTYSLLTFTPEENLGISKRIVDFFKASLQDIFTEHRFLSGSFLVKPSHTEQELLLHQDWCYVEENKYTPVTCWAPLIDTGPQSGSIFLIKGSHHFFDVYRSNSYETARFKVSQLDSTSITYLDIKRGEILLFNPAIWHGSAPNLTANARVALTCLLVPQEAKLVYFQKKDDHTCGIFEMPDTGLELYLKNLVHNELPDSLPGVKEMPYIHSVMTINDLITATSNLLKHA